MSEQSQEERINVARREWAIENGWISPEAHQVLDEQLRANKNSLHNADIRIQELVKFNDALEHRITTETESRRSDQRDWDDERAVHDIVAARMAYVITTLREFKWMRGYAKPAVTKQLIEDILSDTLWIDKSGIEPK
jgi:hypothetical protein